MNKIKKQDLSQRMRSAVSSAPTLNNRFAHAAARAELNPVLPASQPQEEATTQSAPVETIHATVPAAQATTAAPVLVAGGGVLREVPLDQIEPNPFNARHIYRPERVNELATSIGANGQETPGSAVAVDDKVILIAGHYRWKALKRLGRPMLLVVYPPMSDQELYAKSFRENHDREEETALDNALAWRNLIDKGVYSSETEIAEVTGYSLPSINKTMAILGLPEPILAIVRENPVQFKVSLLYELKLFAESAPIEQAIELTQGILAGEVSRKTITDAREIYEKPKTARKQKETSRAYKITRDGRDIGSMKTWDSGRVSFDVKIIDAVERQKLIAELRDRFGLTE
ncbi:ParB/RepB/Spo0J family partition protein [Pseudoduganella sp. FT93W]|uniref:ParB/RepB/Spo0J family partition protein n=1 Tax=Duganella fentianensis TaxID=2692177 RepID=A0A845I228_9BURK|nr:ParB/RepB/Spo0J family partition protein [Duganella fentianensis]MYN47590.1 ParB/RepB/Spo0J family partition protein [Duganella fentianensis]